MDYEEAVMDTFPSRRVSIQAIDKLPKTQELRKHALKRWVALLGHIDFELLLKHATSISRTPLESQTFVKLLLRRLPVNHYTKNKEPRAKECKRCGFQDETISHAIYECRQSSIFWSQVHKVLQELLKQEIGEISLKDVVYFFPSLRRKLTRDQLHVLNVVHSVALYVLWSSRTIRYEYEKHGIDLNWETFTMRLRARIEIEHSESVRIDNTQLSPISSSNANNDNSRASLEEQPSPASASLFVFSSRDQQQSRMDSAFDENFPFSRSDEKIPLHMTSSAGSEERSFLSRWSSSSALTIDRTEDGL
ncbi:MAG: hypothetical protein SGCHY_003170, partial [Lobulomycetales sp.]